VINANRGTVQLPVISGAPTNVVAVITLAVVGNAVSVIAESDSIVTMLLIEELDVGV
jgi:hypothetical protein